MESATRDGRKVRPPWGGDAGYALPAAVVTLSIVVLLAAAAWESVRLEILASRSQVASVVAFHGADGALRAALLGAIADTTMTIGSVEVHLRVEDLVEVTGDARLMQVRAEGRVGGRAPATRRLSALVLRASDASLNERRGSWKEEF